jgi:hypothetical protein
MVVQPSRVGNELPTLRINGFRILLFLPLCAASISRKEAEV